MRLQGVRKDYNGLVFYKLERPEILFLGLFCIRIKSGWLNER